MSKIGRGRSSLQDMKGSFMNSEQQKELYSSIATGGVGPELERGMEGDFLDEEEITGEEPTAPAPKPEKSAKTGDLTEGIEGDVCPECGKIISPEIEFSDEELMNYLLGARITRAYTIGPIEYRIQSITQREVDDANYRTGRDFDSGSAILDVDVNNRQAMYFVAYQLVSIQGKRVGPEMPQNPSVEDFETWHDLIMTNLKSRGHTLLTAISKKCGELEDAIRFTIEDEIRLKK